jgi:hypothetical protein
MLGHPASSQSRPPRYIRSFTSFVADIDLRNQVGCPNSSAGRLLCFNSTAAPINLVVAGDDDVDVTIPIPGGVATEGVSTELEGSFKKIDTGTGALTVTAFWWDGGAPIVHDTTP